MATANAQPEVSHPSPLPGGEGVVDVDWIVREVIRRLRDIGVAQTSGPALRPQPNSSSDLVIEQRLVTLDTLHNRLSGVTSVVVPSRAIVTPAVVDELKDHGISLRRTGGESYRANPNNAHNAATNLPLVINKVEGSDVHALQRLCGSAIAVETSHTSADWLVAVRERIASGTVAVVITNAPAAAVVKANRDRNIRAAVGFNFPAVRQAVEEATANLLAIDPRDKSASQLFGLINEFCHRH